MGASGIPSVTGGASGPATSGLNQNGQAVGGGSGLGNRGFVNNFGQVNPPDVSTSLSWLPYVAGVAAVLLLVLMRKK